MEQDNKYGGVPSIGAGVGVIASRGTLNKMANQPSPVALGSLLDRVSFLESENRNLRELLDKLAAEIFDRISSLEYIIKG